MCIFLYFTYLLNIDIDIAIVRQYHIIIVSKIEKCDIEASLVLINWLIFVVELPARHLSVLTLFSGRRWRSGSRTGGWSRRNASRRTSFTPETETPATRSRRARTRTRETGLQEWSNRYRPTTVARHILRVTSPHLLPCHANQAHRTDVGVTQEIRYGSHRPIGSRKSEAYFVFSATSAIDRAEDSSSKQAYVEWVVNSTNSAASLFVWSAFSVSGRCRIRWLGILDMWGSHFDQMLARPCYESAKNCHENANVFSTKAQM